MEWEERVCRTTGRAYIDLLYSDFQEQHWTERCELQGVGFPGNHQILGAEAENAIEATRTQFET